MNVNTNVNIHNNFITNNWTMGVLIRSDSVPSANASSGILINNNDISGNWYSRIEARANLRYRQYRKQLVRDGDSE